jgi:co-chaperonin GroES (HSP10)
MSVSKLPFRLLQDAVLVKFAQPLDEIYKSRKVLAERTRIAESSDNASRTVKSEIMMARATVVAVGPGAYQDGLLIPMDLTPGDKVFVSLVDAWYDPDLLEYNDEIYVLLRAHNISVVETSV